MRSRSTECERRIPLALRERSRAARVRGDKNRLTPVLWWITAKASNSPYLRGLIRAAGGGICAVVEIGLFLCMNVPPKMREPRSL